VKSPIKSVRSIEGLLRYAYGRAGRFSIPPAVRDAISQEDAWTVDFRAQIQELAAHDPTLKTPVRILAAVDRAHGSLRFRRQCLSAVALALLAHPGLRAVTGLDSALVDLTYGDPPALLRDVEGELRSGDSKLVGPDGKPLKDADRKELAANAVLALALYFAIQRDWSDTTLARELETVLWAEEYSSARGGKRDSTRALLVEGVPGALGTVAQAWRAGIEAALERASSAERIRAYADNEREIAVGLQREAEAESERWRSRLAESEAAIARLNDAIALERQARHVQSSHAVDDYESLRTRVLRSLDRQIALLEDGLHALRNGSTAVTEEYLERVIEALAKQAGSLRDASATEGIAK
jgi:hypothetical protein